MIRHIARISTLYTDLSEPGYLCIPQLHFTLQHQTLFLIFCISRLTHKRFLHAFSALTTQSGPKRWVNIRSLRMGGTAWDWASRGAFQQFFLVVSLTKVEWVALARQLQINLQILSQPAEKKWTPHHHCLHSYQTGSWYISVLSKRALPIIHVLRMRLENTSYRSCGIVMPRHLVSAVRKQEKLGSHGLPACCCWPRWFLEAQPYSYTVPCASLTLITCIWMLFFLLFIL